MLTFTDIFYLTVHFGRFIFVQDSLSDCRKQTSLYILVHHYLGVFARHRSLKWTFLSYNCGTVLLKSLSLSHSVFKQGRELVADIVLLTDYLVHCSDKTTLLSQLVVIPKVFSAFRHHCRLSFPTPFWF